jgi:hypothetical protein
MPYLLMEMRSERNSNPRGGFPHQPHFQTVRAACTEGHGRALRIQIRSAQGTARQAKARALGLDFRAGTAGVERDSHLR